MPVSRLTPASPRTRLPPARTQSEKNDSLRREKSWSVTLTFSSTGTACAADERARTTFYSLQVGPASEQVSQMPRDTRLLDLASELKDFADTAAIVASLNMVISIDSSVAHLAGAMGKPVWVLLNKGCDWRWLLEREDSP